MPRFVIDGLGRRSRVLELLGDRPISIGSAKSSNLSLDDASVSRLHAVVRSTMDGHWQIVDRGGASGIKVNGARVKEATLRPNDEVVIGAYRLRFEEPDVRGVAAHDAASLPRSVVRELGQSAYSGSLLPVEPLGSVESPEAEGRGQLSERVRVLERENRLLTLLYRVTRALAELTEVEKVTERVLQMVLEIEGAERGYVMLLDESSSGSATLSEGQYGFQPAVIRYRREPRELGGRGTPPLVISRSIIRQVMQTGLPLLVCDAQADPRLSASPSVVLSGIQSAMCAPLGSHDRRSGLLYVDNLSRRGMFSVEDLNIFAVIASQAGLAIERVRVRNTVPVKNPPAVLAEKPSR
jgi:pSer/pThr/pTyr-binding forkhead associated (FHA) protein